MINKEFLEVDAALGDRYKSAWDDLVEPFFEKKQKELYESFTACSPSDNDTINTIMHHSKALESLKDEFEHHINTGNLAKIALDDKVN